MSSGSVRLHAAHSIHQREVVSGTEDGTPAIPDSRCEVVDDVGECPVSGRLWRENGRLMYQAADGGDPAPARVAWARPLSGRGGPVSVLLAGKKKELAYLPSLEVLPEESRRIALEELDSGMVLPRITVITRVWPRFGNYYWDVETDMGPKKFLLSAPENNSLRPKGDMLVIKDVAGNCYEINPVSGLDKSSLQELDRVL